MQEEDVLHVAHKNGQWKIARFYHIHVKSTMLSESQKLQKKYQRQKNRLEIDGSLLDKTQRDKELLIKQLLFLIRQFLVDIRSA
jgi:hypothetical protein